MDEKWFFTLPDFDNEEKWTEDRPMECASNESFSDVILHTLGSAPNHLYLGMVIRRRSRSDPRMIVDEYRLPLGRKPFILKWWIDGDEDRFGIAAKLPDGSWLIRLPGQIPCWILTYDGEKRRMKFFGLAFKVAKKGELN